MTRPALGAWLGLGLLVALPALAGDEVSEAKRLFEFGMEELAAGHDEAALDWFLKSRAVHATRAATQNAALVMKRLGRHDEALELLRAMPREFPGMTAAQLEAVRAEIEELEGSTGLIEVQSSETGATVVIAGRARGTVPLAEPVRVNPGRHRVTIVRNDHEVASETVHVAARSRVVARPVRPAPTATTAATPPPVAPRPRVPVTPAVPLRWHRLRLGLGPSMIVPSGNYDDTTPLSEKVGWGLGLTVDVGFSPLAQLEIGGRLSAASLTPTATCEDGPAGTTISCAASLMRLGASATYRMAGPTARWIPYLGLGLDYDWMTVYREARSTAGVDDESYSDSCLSPRAELGLDLTLSRTVLLGPHASGSLGSYHAGATHAWLDLGLRVSWRMLER